MDRKELLFTTRLEHLAQNSGDLPAITCETTLTYHQLYDASRRCALSLAAAGVQRGDRVLLWGLNGADWLVEFIGIIMAGGVATLMNYGLNAEDVTRLTKNVDAKWALIGGNRVSAQDPKAAAQAVIEGGVPMDHIMPMADLFKASMDLSRPIDPENFRMLAEQVRPEDTQYIIFTSGTTSLPKAVQLSSYSTLSDVDAVNEYLKDDWQKNCCVALPLFHSFGLVCVLLSMCNGSHTHLIRDIKPNLIRDTIAENGIELLATVGAVYSGLTMLPDFESKLAGRLKLCVVGGGFTTPTEMMRVENMLGGGKMLIGYGQTECSPVISVNIPTDPLERRAVSVGRILPGLDVRIWREDTGFLKTGEIGEVVVKGPIVMNGYLGLAPEEQPFDADGWLHTGDLGMIAEDGLLLLAGRIKDIIIRSGENISPSEIEKVMMENPAIRQVKVLGAPHPIWGESVEACVVYNGEAPDEATMRASLEKRLSKFKIPSHFFTYSEFPLNSNGKLDQRGLKADMLEKLRAIFIRNALDDGLRIVKLKVGNRTYTITPVCDLVQGIAEQLGFRGRQVIRIRLAVEEMLTERIENAYEATGGEITLEVVLMPQWLRLRFSDTGKPYHLEGEDVSLSAKIILANVDAYSSSLSDDNIAGCNLDWQYQDDFDINDYLMQNQEAGRA